MFYDEDVGCPNLILYNKGGKVTLGPLGHLARWLIWPVGRLGHLAHVGGWLIWAVVRFAYFGGRSRLGGSKAKAVLTPKGGPKTQQHNMDHAPPQVTCTINRSHTCKRALAHQSHCPHDPTFMANHTPDANKLYSCTEQPSAVASVVPKTIEASLLNVIRNQLAKVCKLRGR